MFQTTFAYAAVILVNICFCHDLIYTLRDPFKKPEARYPQYYALILTISGIVATSRIYDPSNKKYLQGYFIILLFYIYLGFAIASVIFAIRFVGKPGISSEARNLIVRIHISYILVNCLCQFYSIYSKLVVPLRILSDSSKTAETTM